MPPSSKPELPVVLVKWYDYAKWVLERVESFPKSHRFVLGQRLANQVMDVLEIPLREIISLSCRLTEFWISGNWHPV